MLALLALILLTAIRPTVDPASPTAPSARSPAEATNARDADLRLYDAIVRRVASGENYYVAAVDEQRARSFPVRPGFALRLPTLAVVQARLGILGSIVASSLLFAAIGIAWWRRCTAEGLVGTQRRVAVALILAGSSLLLNPYYHVLHELWAGGLIALSLALHRPGRWQAALGVAALALAIRELALPFVLLMGAMASWRRDWKEASAWAVLAAMFVAMLAYHHALAASHTTTADLAGPSWLTLRGLAGWTANVVMSSQLHALPIAIAGPIPILALLGWTGWRTTTGATVTLLLLGYAAAFMIAGRDGNFYWGLIVTPIVFAGLVFLPMSLRSLCQAAVDATHAKR
ncbi:hypothetical protein ACWPM1_03830 [Tsuneonella sp. HG249]